MYALYTDGNKGAYIETVNDANGVSRVVSGKGGYSTMYALDKDGNKGAYYEAINDANGVSRVVSGPGGYSTMYAIDKDGNQKSRIETDAYGSVVLSPETGGTVMINNNGKLCFNDSTGIKCVTKSDVENLLKLIGK